MTDIAIRIHTTISTFIAQLREERGQDLLEYALIGGFVAAAIVAAVVFLSADITSMFANIGDCVDFEGATACNPGP